MERIQHRKRSQPRAAVTCDGLLPGIVSRGYAREVSTDINLPCSFVQCGSSPEIRWYSGRHSPSTICPHPYASAPGGIHLRTWNRILNPHPCPLRWDRHPASTPRQAMQEILKHTLTHVQTHTYHPRKIIHANTCLPCMQTNIVHVKLIFSRMQMDVYSYQRSVDLHKQVPAP